MRGFLAFVAAGCVVLPASAQAALVAAANAVDPAHREAALGLARTIFSNENQMAGMDRFLDDSFGPMLLQDSNIKELENELPGTVAAVVEALRPLFRTFMTDQLPAYHAGVADIYVAHFSKAELVEMQRSFAAPTGQKMVRGVLENMTFDRVMSETMTDPEAPTSREALEKDQRDSVIKTVGSMTREDMEWLLQVAKTSWYPKLRAVRPKLLDFELKFMNEPSPDFEAEVERVTGKVIGDRMAKGLAKTRT